MQRIKPTEPPETGIPVEGTEPPPGDAAEARREADMEAPPEETEPEPPTSFAESVGEVNITPDTGAYPSSVTVYLSCPTEGVEVRYTLDSSDPDESSPLYDSEEGLLLRQSAPLKARAYKEGHEPSPIALSEYEVRAPVWRENEPEDRSDVVDHAVKESARYSGWRISGASVRGKLHAHRALWREDAFSFGSIDDWTIIAVSDGAGSVPLSRVGARLACEEAVAYLKESLQGFALVSESEEGLKESEMPRLLRLLAGAAGAALTGIRTEAAERSRLPEEFAATLLVAVHRPWRGRRLVGSIQVGDGTVALLDWDGDVTLLGVPDHGDHSSETRFLTTQGVEETFQNRVLFSLKDRLRCIAAMSDGVSDDFFPEDKRMRELFLGESLPGMSDRDGCPARGVMESVTGSPDPAAALLEWIRYEKRGSSDDRTLVLFWGEG